MKRTFVTVIAVLLLACLIAPGSALAFAETEEDVTYLFNPTAIAVVGDRLFVADNTEEGQSIILCFDVSGSPRQLFATNVAGTVTNLSAKENGLYVVLRDKVIEYTIDANALRLGQTYNERDVVNFTQGYLNGSLTEYFASGGAVQMRGTSGEFERTAGTFTQVLDIVAIDETTSSDDEYLYVLFQDAEGVLNCERIRNGLSPSDAFNDANAATKVDGAKGLFTWKSGDKTFPGMFSDDTLSFVEIATNSCTNVEICPYEHSGATIVDAVAQEDVIYILNSDHQVDVYKKIAGQYTATSTIGTDTRSVDVPALSDFNSFTLVKSVGYPSNIIFRTSDDATSVEQLVDDAEEYIVLGYNGSDADKFYYVLYGDKFGWVKKNSDATTDPADDPNLEVVDTTFGTESMVNYKFVSMYAVWVYPLPRESFAEYRHAFSQGASKRADAAVLQQFTDGDTVWYYVRYDGEKTGFVKQENVDVFMNVDTTNVKVVGQRKANGKLFGYVQLYDNNNPETMNSEHHAKDKDGKEVPHLSGGTRVTLIKEYDNGTALVQVLYDDGTSATGYCYSNQLIKQDSLSTNSIFGLITVGIAIVLAIILTIVFTQRKKRKKKKAETQTVHLNQE